MNGTLTVVGGTLDLNAGTVAVNGTMTVDPTIVNFDGGRGHAGSIGIIGGDKLNSVAGSTTERGLHDSPGHDRAHG